MNTTVQLDMAADNNIQARRETIRQSLNDITVKVSNGLRDAGLSYPVYLVVPSNGRAIVSMVTPANPSDLDWYKIGDIIREIVSERLDGSVELPCTMVNATMGAAEIAAD